MLNLFNSVFLKRCYIYSESFGDEIKDKKKRKKTTLKREFRFLAFGCLCNYVWMFYIYDKLNFFILDEILNLFFTLNSVNKSLFYFTILMFISSHRFYQYLTKTHNLILGNLLILIAHYIISIFIENNSTNYPKIVAILAFCLLKYLITKLRFFSILIILIYILHNAISQSLIPIESPEYEEIKILLFFTNIGMIVTTSFIILVYSNLDFIKIYIRINERIFIFKFIFDMSLYISFIYKFVNYDKQNYLTHFNNLKYIFISILLFQYVLTYFFLNLRLIMKIKMSDIT